ncbi:MAG TPA: hypothetical protein VFW11_11630 [Cyclobacteriaceae bacterium]|nr:hypothetical protein [Cyclobacteriaceae bacterium]
MLRYFRINDPYRLLGVLVIGVLLFLPAFIDTPSITYPELKSFIIGEKIREGNLPYAELVDSTPPLTCWLYGAADLFFGRSLVARHIFSFLIIFCQGIYLAVICINRKVFADSSYLPPLLFIVLFAFSYDTLALTGELMGSGFLLLAINNLYKELEFRTQRDDAVIGLGLFVSFASLCSFAYAVFLVASILILVFYSRRDPRTLMLLIVGFTIPHVLLISTYFLIGDLDGLVRYYYLPNLSFQSNSFVTLKALLLLGIVPMGFFLISLFVLSREGRLTKYQSQVLQSMFFWLVFSLVFLFFTKDLRPQSLIVVIPSLSFFLTHFYLSLQRRLIAELTLWIFLLGIGLMSYLSWRGSIRGVDYDELTVRQNSNNTIVNQRLLVLADDPSYYKDNILATPFMNWGLSKSVFENPDYYENIVWVYESFRDDPPTYIIDPNGYMKPFFDRIPALKGKYHTLGEGNYLRK